MSTPIQDIEEIQSIYGVKVDGDIGKKTIAASEAEVDAMKRTSVQMVLLRTTPGLKIDGQWGPKSRAALLHLDELGDIQSAGELGTSGKIPKPESDGWHHVQASSFADPADVRAFRVCKDRGGSDQACFRVGDNGIGKWGANCAQDIVPMVALPREVWRNAGKTGGAKVAIRYNGKELVAALGDTMPSLENIHNGAGMDTNPAVALFFGLHPPYMKPMDWKWA